MADAAGDSDIDPALFARLAADPLADRLGMVATALARVFGTDRPWVRA